MIRPYKPQDLPVLMDIGNRAWREIYRMYRECYGDELFACIYPDAATGKGREIRSFCEKNPQCVYVCEEEGRVVGFITFWLTRSRKIGEIGNNAVDPDCRGKGIGQQMYKAVLDHFRQEGLAFAQVRTGLDAAHAPARRAYERAGFNIQEKWVTYFMNLHR